MKIEIKSRYSDKVLFAHEQENNTIKITLELAVKAGANLTYARLTNADLTNANLTNADLTYADLTYARLTNADLTNANLTGANLTGASLLCVGNMKNIFTMQLDYWKIGFTKDTLQIGCQRHSLEKWKTFDDEIINKMDNKALEYWKKWKDHIFKTIELCNEP